MAYSQPNVLLIVADQFRGDCLSSAGHPVVMTPNLDGLIASGTSFSRAYSTCPSCAPARRSLLTGMHPSTHGLLAMRGTPPLTHQTFPDILRRGGYQTALIGRKMHQYPASARYGYEQVTLGSTSEPDDALGEDIRDTGQGNSVHSAGLSFNDVTARSWPLDESVHPTTWVTEKCRSFLKDSDETCPLFLTASYQAPHPPLFPPAFYFERYLKMDLPSPALGEWVDEPPAVRAMDSHRFKLEGEALKSAQAGYFGLINHLDDQLYWLIDNFKKLSAQRGREWVIVFTSDHGEMLGDHHYIRKCEPYEGSARIPLIISGSPTLNFQKARHSETLTCLEDIFPTLLELAGIRGGYEPIDGKSLVPVLRGESSVVREFLHGEHSEQYSPEQANHYLTDGRWKYIWRSMTGKEQLFDLGSDRRELVDLCESAPDILQRLRDELISRLEDRPENFVQKGKIVPVTKTRGFLFHA